MRRRARSEVREKAQTRGSCPACGGRVTTGSRTGYCRNCWTGVCRQNRNANIQVEDLKPLLQSYKPEADTWRADELARRALETAAQHYDYTTEFPRIEGDVALCSDVHVPYHDPQMCERFRLVAEKLGISTAVVNGDLVDWDQISDFRMGVERLERLSETLHRGLVVLASWATTFQHIWIVKGNHDDRLERLIEAASRSRTTKQLILGDLDAEDLRDIPYRHRYVSVLELFAKGRNPELAKRVTWLPAAACWLDGPPGEKPYFALHPAAYSKHATLELRDIWAREQVSLVSAHTHHGGMRLAPNAVDVWLNPGCMTREIWHRYPHERIKGGPRWTRGFLTFQGGVARTWIDSPYCTNWSEIDGRGDGTAA